MAARSVIIRDAYRAALADWARHEIAGISPDRDIIDQTASIASTCTNTHISAEDVLAVLGATEK